MWIARAIEAVRGRRVNRIRHPHKTYEHVRYEFTNRSEDIKLHAFIGPKR